MSKVKVSFVDGREEYFEALSTCKGYVKEETIFDYSKDDEMFFINKPTGRILLPREFVRYICVAD